jgi:hypothetical protein
MLRQTIYIFTILSGLVSCSDNNVTEKWTENLFDDTVWVTVKPKNYLDFEYSKVKAFATVDPFDYSELYFAKKLDPSKFHDTISVTLDSLQTANN